MSFTEVSNQSWFGRIGGAFKGIIFGIIMVLISVPLLFWNEGRAVKRAMTLAAGRDLVVADVPIDTVNSANEGKLVHMTGTATSTDTLVDEMFNISVDNAIKLARRVEMYQWKEEKDTQTKKKLGGGETTVTEYSYHKVWNSTEIDSGQFHEGGQGEYGSGNPPMPYSDSTFVSDKVKFGAFQLSRGQVDQVSGYVPIELAETDLEKIADETLRNQLVLDNNSFYQGQNPSSPQIGDLRIRFEFVGPVEISFVYQQAGNSFRPYDLPKGNIQLFSMGKVGADDLFTQAETANKMMTWLIRLGGFLLMTIGIGLTLRPLSVLADVVPLFGSLVGAGIFFLSAILAAILALITVAIAWLFYRPMLAIILIAVAIGLILLARRFLKAKKQTAMATDSPDDGIPVVG